MARSQHKETLRKCPVCEQEKLFPERNETCGGDCANEMQRRRAGKQESTKTESHERTDSEWNISLPSTRIHTLEALVAHFQIDTAVWEIYRFVANKWEVAGKDNNNVLQVEPLYQVKAWMRKKLHVAAAVAEIEALREAADVAIRIKPAKYRPQKRGIMTELSIPDLHINKLAWGKETRHASYDSDIAVKLHDTALDALLQRTAHVRPDAITLVFGNDLLNTDNAVGTTTSGTRQDTDTRYKRGFVMAREMATRAILRCREVAPVRVVMVPGNHDTETVWHLGDSLWCLFRQDKHVAIDNGPAKRKYVEHGQCLLLFTHGNEEKRPDLPLLMAAEESKAWGRTRWREVHVGHWHQEGLIEKMGVRVRLLSSLCPPDFWHSSKGYIGNIRKADAFVWHKDDGLILTATYSHWE